MDFKRVVVFTFIWRICIVGETSAAAGPGSTGGIRTGPAPADGSVLEYCQKDAFEARCAADEVIVISQALFGRRDFGRCVRQGLDNVGCYTDVRRQVDARCSGRQRCQISPADKMNMFNGLAPCRRDDLMLHLEIGYTCVKVLVPVSGQCRNALPSSVPPSAADRATAAASVDGHRLGSGLLTSVVSAATGCGSPANPWMIDVEPGQRINVSLIDFSLVGNGSGSAGSDRSFCQVYAVIKEQRGGLQGVTVCSSDGSLDGMSATDHRERPVYLSTTNAVEIRLLTARSTQDSGGYFMLRYQPVGCADVAPPRNGWWKRDGNNASVGCSVAPSGGHSARTVWRQNCVGNTWVGDLPTSCPDLAAAGQTSWMTTTHSMTAALIVCIACIVGLAVFTAGFCIIKRRCRARDRKPAASARPIYHKEDPGSIDPAYRQKCDSRSMYHTATAVARPYIPTPKHYAARAEGSSFLVDDSACCGGGGANGSGSAIDNEYAYVDDVYGAHGYTTCTGITPPPPPPANNSGVHQSSAAASVHHQQQQQQQQQGCVVDPAAAASCYQYNLLVDGRPTGGHVDEEEDFDEVDGDGNMARWQLQQQQLHHQLQLQQQQQQRGGGPAAQLHYHPHHQFLAQ